MAKIFCGKRDRMHLNKKIKMTYKYSAIQNECLAGWQILSTKEFIDVLNSRFRSDVEKLYPYQRPDCVRT
ncbi:MAG: hypothetical protein ACJ749_12565 [Flavisolibacter sp.]